MCGWGSVLLLEHLHPIFKHAYNVLCQCVCVHVYVHTYDVYCVLLCVAGISSEQFAVMEQKLEKSWASEKALRAEVKLWKTKLQEVRPPPPGTSWAFPQRCWANAGLLHVMLNACGCFYIVVFCDSLERLGRYVHTYVCT